MSGEVEVDDRTLAAWRSWLGALATDADATMAAAFVYESLPPDGRDAWLDALEKDAPTIGISKVALYAPLIAVEADEVRLSKMMAAMAVDLEDAVGISEPKALRGVGADGLHVCVLTSPIYMAFVQVIHCRYSPSGGFVTVRYEPLCSAAAVDAIRHVDGVPVEPTPIHLVIDDLAHAILADRRMNRATPASLVSFAHLFVPVQDVELSPTG